jgi:hypothetical protein
MCPRCFCRGKRRGFHIEDEDVKREREFVVHLSEEALSSKSFTSTRTM